MKQSHDNHDHDDVDVIAGVGGVGDGLYNVKVEGKPRKGVPADHLAPFFKLDEKVLYTPASANSNGASSAKNKAPKQVPGRIISVDVSIWPPSYVFKEANSKTERDTEGGRVISEELAQARDYEGGGGGQGTKGEEAKRGK